MARADGDPAGGPQPGRSQGCATEPRHARVADHAGRHRRGGAAWVACSGSSSGSSRWSPAPSPGLPQRRAAGRDRRGAAARVRQQRADPLPRPADGAQRLPRRALAGRPRPARAVRLDAGRGAHRQLQEHADEQLRLHRAGHDRLRARDDLPPAGSGCAARRRPGCHGRRPTQRHQVRRARAILEVNGTEHPLEPPGLVVGRGTEADLRINDPGVSPPARRVRRRRGEGTGRRIRCVDLGSTNGMLVDGTAGPAGRRSPTAARSGSATRR